MLRDVILEAKDIQFFKVEEVPGAQPIKLRISGLAFNSAMSVNKITTKVIGPNILVVDVHLAHAKPGTSGSFQYELTVPDYISEVRFGNDMTSIWTRGAATLRSGS